MIGPTPTAVPAGPAGRRRLLGAVLAGYLLALLLVLGWPSPVDVGVNGTLFEALSWLHTHGLPAWIGYDVVEFTANIALFVPLGLLLTLELRRRRWWLVALVGIGTSMLAELAQGALRPDRFATPRDVIANSAGTLLGVAIAALASTHPPRVRPTAIPTAREV